MKGCFRWVAWAWLSAACVFPQTHNVATNQDIIELVKTGFDTPTVLAYIDGHEPQFDLSADSLIKLKDAGVSDRLVQAMINAQSGAKRDIRALVEGVHVRSFDSSGRLRTQELPAETFQEVDHAVLYWLPRGVKSYGWIKGPASAMRVRSPLELLFRCSEGVSPTEYHLMRLNARRERRDFAVVRDGIGRPSSGDPKKTVLFEPEKLDSGTYRVRVSLEKGEYGFLPPGGGARKTMASGTVIHTFAID